jgi:hypothetical protein
MPGDCRSDPGRLQQAHATGGRSGGTRRVCVGAGVRARSSGRRGHRSLNIPTIGIGAGAGCDGQILVLQDLLGMNVDFRPKFARPFIEGGRCVIDALARSTRR